MDQWTQVHLGRHNTNQSSSERHGKRATYSIIFDISLPLDVSSGFFGRRLLKIDMERDEKSDGVSNQANKTRVIMLKKNIFSQTVSFFSSDHHQQSGT